MLERAGARVVVWPTIDFEPSGEPEALDRALAGLSDFAWVVFTSPRAVESVTARVDRCPVGVRIAAVGASTQRSLTRAGWDVDVVGREGAEALVDSIASAGELSDRRVLFPASSLAADTVEAEVRLRGGRVDRVEAYRTVPHAPERERVLDDLEHGVDVVTFASPSAARSLATALDREWPAVLHGCGIAAIGPTTAAALADLGVHTERVEIADPTGLDGLLDAVIRALPAPSSTGGNDTEHSLEPTAAEDDAS